MPGMRVSLLAVLVGLSVAAAAPATALAAPAPTLGLKTANTTWGVGFGAVRPSAINFNGDPTSYIDKIHWKSWGGSQAVGHGIAGFTWPGFSVADGTRYVTATVVAFDLGKCDGHPAYQREEWYFPQYGETFAPKDAVFDLCTGKALNRAAPPGPVYCPKGQLNTWVSGSVTCAELPKIEALVGGARHRGHSAKWISHGWICGTDLRNPQPQSVTCQSGNDHVVSFKI